LYCKRIFQDNQCQLKFFSISLVIFHCYWFLEIVANPLHIRYAATYDGTFSIVFSNLKLQFFKLIFSLVFKFIQTSESLNRHASLFGLNDSKSSHFIFVKPLFPLILSGNLKTLCMSLVTWLSICTPNFLAILLISFLNPS
jgi:hypothetical protein